MQETLKNLKDCCPCPCIRIQLEDLPDRDIIRSEGRSMTLPWPMVRIVCESCGKRSPWSNSIDYAAEFWGLKNKGGKMKLGEVRADFSTVGIGIGSETERRIKFCAPIVCECGERVYKNDNFCRTCGAAVEMCGEVEIEVPQEELCQMFRERLEKEFEARKGEFAK